MLTDKTWLRLFLEGERNKVSRAWLALLIFTLALLILSVWGLKLPGHDSPRVAGIAREMAVTSNYLIPRLNGENFLEYPPLGYWPIALTLSVSHKPTDFLAFIPIVFFGTGTVLITYLIVRTLAGERIGLMAGFILATTVGFVTLHRHCLVDPVLLFFITLSMYGFVGDYRTSRKSFLFSAIFYLAMAGAFLSKGIIGVTIPAATAVVFLIIQKDLSGIRTLLLSRRILLFLVPIFSWVGIAWWLEGPGIFMEVIRQSLFRFFSHSADHAKPPHFYLYQTFIHLMPWTLLPLVHGSLLKFAAIWFAIIFVGLSLLRKVSTLPRADIPPFFTHGSPRMGPFSRKIS